MDKKLSNRFKQLIGESIAEDKKPLLSSENVTDESLADRLAESEATKAEKEAEIAAEEKSLNEGWEIEEVEVISENEDNDKEVLSESTEDTVYDLSFLNEGEEK